MPVVAVHLDHGGFVYHLFTAKCDLCPWVGEELVSEKAARDEEGRHRVEHLSDKEPAS